MTSYPRKVGITRPEQGSNLDSTFKIEKTKGSPKPKESKVQKINFETVSFMAKVISSHCVLY